MTASGAVAETDISIMRDTLVFLFPNSARTALGAFNKGHWCDGSELIIRA